MFPCTREHELPRNGDTAVGDTRVQGETGRGQVLSGPQACQALAVPEVGDTRSDTGTEGYGTRGTQGTRSWGHRATGTGRSGTVGTTGHSPTRSWGHGARLLGKGRGTGDHSDVAPQGLRTRGQLSLSPTLLSSCHPREEGHSGPEQGHVLPVPQFPLEPCREGEAEPLPVMKPPGLSRRRGARLHSQSFYCFFSGGGGAGGAGS